MGYDMSSLNIELDARIAERMVSLLDRAGHSVTAFVPSGYERYVRVLNPIETTDGSTVMWSELVNRNGLEANPWMQWDELKALPGADLPDEVSEPGMGRPHASLAEGLIRTLGVDSRPCYFASWVGYAEQEAAPAAIFPPNDREMILYSGALLDGVGEPEVPTIDGGRVPMYWWPEGLEWCVGQDIYARSLIVACDLPTAGRILAAERLDSFLIRESDQVFPEDW